MAPPLEMPQLLRSVYPDRLKSGTFAVTVNVKAQDLEFFLSEEHGCCFFSNDGNPPGGLQEGMRRLYTLAGKSPPTRFTSLALRTPEIARSANQTLRSFGPITLEIDFSRVTDDLILFSGDAQCSAHQLEKITFIDHQVGTRALLSILKQLHDNAASGATPRRISAYYEARLLRPLVVSDITRIYIHGSAGLRAAQALCGLAGRAD